MKPEPEPDRNDTDFLFRNSSTVVSSMIIIKTYQTDGMIHTDLSRFNRLEFDSPVNQAVCELEFIKSGHNDSFKIINVIVCGIK